MMSPQPHSPSRPRTMPQPYNRQEFLMNGLVDTLQPFEGCPICQEPHNEPVLLIQCGHVFCKPCILEWCNRLARGTCPCCRKQLWTQYDPIPTRVLDGAETVLLLEQIQRFTGYASIAIDEVREVMVLRSTPVAESDIIWALAEGIRTLSQDTPIDDQQEVIIYHIPCATAVEAMAVLLPLWYRRQTGSGLSFEEYLEWRQIVALVGDVLQNDWQGLIGTHFSLGHRLEAIINDHARIEGMQPTSTFQDLWISDWFRHEDDEGPAPSLGQTTQRQMLDRLIEHIFRCASPIATQHAEQVEAGWRWG